MRFRRDAGCFLGVQPAGARPRARRRCGVADLARGSVHVLAERERAARAALESGPAGRDSPTEEPRPPRLAADLQRSVDAARVLLVRPAPGGEPEVECVVVGANADRRWRLRTD